VTEDSGVRTALVLGPILTCIGIAWTFIAPSNLSSTAVLVGFATAIWGTHKFGRHGLDRGVEGDAAQADERATDAP
jgi:hypothetical protein